MKDSAEEIIELSRWRVTRRDDRLEYRFLIQRDGMWVTSGHVEFAVDRPEWRLLERFVRALFRDIEEAAASKEDQHAS